MSKILVKATMTTGGKGQGVGVDYDISGKPVFVMGQGGGAGRGRSGREKTLGRFGGALGALAGFTGLGGAQHRSLGSALGGAIGSGYQGAALGGSLGRYLTGKNRQAEVNLQEQQSQDRAEILAHKNAGVPLPERLGGEGKVKVRSSRPRQEGQESQVGVYDSRINAMAEQMGVTPQEFMTGLGGLANASTSFDPNGQGVSETNMGPSETNMGPTDASGTQVQVLSPSNMLRLPPPGGTMESGKEDADPDAGKLQQDGFNNTTEGEPSDIQYPQLGDNNNASAAQQASMAPKNTFVRPNERSDEERFNEQTRLPLGNKVKVTE